ncbi:MAG: hypothetical protein LBD92_03515 [Oscillospiraceae bacterium]|nr:hypothetical protein [Oscillospiraceae bacterium]
MADVVRIALDEGQRAVTDIRTKADEIIQYIDSQLSQLITNFSGWWEGDAYNAFLEDWNATKAVFRSKIYDEIIAYSNNLDTAVKSQSEQDISNAGAIKIN